MTGLSPHVIRIWERRYGAVTPRRTPTNRRLYSDADIERLRLLRQAVALGHSISRIAALPDEEIMQLVTEPAHDTPRAARVGGDAAKTASGTGQQAASFFVESAFTAIGRLDALALEEVMARASLSLGVLPFLEEVAAPFMDSIGLAWRAGKVRVAQEHMASALVRTFLGDILRNVEPPEGAPDLIAGTPPRQDHELGALMAAVVAASEGWRVTYLGPNVPIEEVCIAAEVRRARAVALSIVFPPDDPHLPRELRQFRKILRRDTAILAGGASAAAYKDVLEPIGAVTLSNLGDLPDALRGVREASSG